MPKKIDYSGKKFNHLTLLKYARPGGAGVGAIWMAQCDCKSVREVIAKDVVRGRLKTCGNCEYNHRVVQMGHRSKTKRRAKNFRDYSRTLSKALNNNQIWDLTIEQFNEIVKQPCTYCGNANKSNKSTINKIDLLEVQNGYALDNCISACSVCKRMKGSSNYEEFIDYIIRVRDNTKDLLYRLQNNLPIR